jgi:hypothetical protein
MCSVHILYNVFRFLGDRNKREADFLKGRVPNLSSIT